ncbi:hypothetical protein GGX14DRAFT_392520 [Mycena pura]|uniref:Uncharacterized protein n=1 Tax=Mycena pura TaxID=153505 RepID=A0AAD6VMV4_9AGAR|nr:hypothetical protein GGX14DRAFT_392520 [Mycena pura]
MFMCDLPGHVIAPSTPASCAAFASERAYLEDTAKLRVQWYQRRGNVSQALILMQHSSGSQRNETSAVKQRENVPATPGAGDMHQHRGTRGTRPDAQRWKKAGSGHRRRGVERSKREETDVRKTEITVLGSVTDGGNAGRCAHHMAGNGGAWRERRKRTAGMTARRMSGSTAADMASAMLDFAAEYTVPSYKYITFKYMALLYYAFNLSVNISPSSTMAAAAASSGARSAYQTQVASAEQRAAREAGGWGSGGAAGCRQLGGGAAEQRDVGRLMAGSGRRAAGGGRRAAGGERRAGGECA